MGFAAPFCWNSLISPGWAIVAMSGGLPPWTAVPTTVGTLSPAEVYLTLTFGYDSLNLSITAWKDFCSSPVQMPTTEPWREGWVFGGVADGPPPPLPPPPPPQPASASSAVATRASGACRWRRCLITVVLLPSGFRRRSRARSPDRRSAVGACRRRP